eukprot:PhF_6_TR20688/c0_g1_i1/m.29763
MSSLAPVPQDVLVEIMSHLRMKDVYVVIAVSRRFFALGMCEAVWGPVKKILSVLGDVRGPEQLAFEFDLWAIYQEHIRNALSCPRSSFGCRTTIFFYQYVQQSLQSFIVLMCEHRDQLKTIEATLWEDISKAQEEAGSLRVIEERIHAERSSLSEQGAYMKQCLLLLQEEHECLEALQTIEATLGISDSGDRQKRMLNLTALTDLFTSYTRNLELQTAKERTMVEVKTRLQLQIEKQTKLNQILQQVLSYMVLLQQHEGSCRNTHLWLVSILRAVETKL